MATVSSAPSGLSVLPFIYTSSHLHFTSFISTSSRVLSFILPSQYLSSCARCPCTLPLFYIGSSTLPFLYTSLIYTSRCLHFPLSTLHLQLSSSTLLSFTLPFMYTSSPTLFLMYTSFNFQLHFLFYTLPCLHFL